MKQLLLVLLSTMGFAQTRPDFAIHFGHLAYVQISYRYNPKPVKIIVGTFNVLPAFQNPERIDTLAVGNRSKVYSIDVRTPQQGYVEIGRIHYDLYLVPTDTVRLVIDFGQDTAWHDRCLTFSGSLAPLQEYYRKRNLALRNFDYLRAFAANNAPTLSGYQKTMDSLYLMERSFYATYQQRQSLPAWFRIDVDRQIIYADAALRENAINYRRFVNKGKEEVIPKGYFNYQKAAPVNNVSAIHLTGYWQYVRDNFFLKSGRKVGQLSEDIWLRKEFAFAHTLLSSVGFDYYKAITLSSWAMSDPNDALKLIDQYAPTFQKKN